MIVVPGYHYCYTWIRPSGRLPQEIVSEVNNFNR
jgi:hypothetical protein